MIIRVPFLLLFGFNNGTYKDKGQKGTTGEPSEAAKQAKARREVRLHEQEICKLEGRKWKRKAKEIETLSS